MQYMGSGEVSLELRYGYDHYVFLEKKTEQLDEEMKGYTRKHWKNEYLVEHFLSSFP